MTPRNCLLPLALWLLAGCASTTATGSEGRELTLLRPADQSLTRGETNDVLITLERDNFDDPVEVRFENLPPGVRLVEPEALVPAGDLFENFTLFAEPDAELVQDHQVTVTATGPDGLSVSETFQIDVSE